MPAKSLVESVRALGFGIAVLFCLTIACGGDDYDGALDGRRLRRTSFKNWRVKEFPLAGVRAEIPKKPFSVSDNATLGAYISMHAATWPIWSPGDAQLLLKITLERMNREDFEVLGARVAQSVSYQEGDEETRRFWDWVVSRHETIERYDFKGYTYLQFEITCADETVVRMNAELVNLRRNGVAVHEAEDEQAIRRIFNSVKCIEQTPLPERSSG